jgi:hypothetical protein
VQLVALVAEQARLIEQLRARSPSHSRPPPNHIFSKNAICLS